MKAADSGAKVFDALMDNAQGLTMRQLQKYAGLKLSQCRTGIDYIRRILATDEGQPLIYEPVSQRYSLAMVERDSVAYVVFRLKVAAVQMERLKTSTVIPSERKFGKTQTIRRLADDMGRVERDLQFLLDEVRGSAPLFTH